MSAAKKVINIAVLFSFICIFSVASSSSPIYASDTSNFTQTINAGTLAVDIVDGSYATVATPSVAFAPYTFNFTCQSSTGILGTASEQIYVSNPDAADAGWVLSIAGSATTAVWDGAASDYDFNDPTGSGCTDGADTDSVGGAMTVDPSSSTLAVGQCTGGCDTTNITKGVSSSFSEGVVNSITLLTAASGSSDIGDWTLRDIDVSQMIPAGQAPASDYDIDMVVSVVAN